jgi:hypothetical protein
MTTVGWIPFILFFSQVDPRFEDFFPLLIAALFVTLIIFVFVKVREDEPKYELKLNR